jgi:nucleoid DNA-binding protein/phage tail protein X
MSTAELISSLAQKLSLSKTEASQRLEDAITEITSELLKNNSVSFNTFGSIEIEKRDEKITISPSSGKRILVPPKLILKFKPLDIDRQETEAFLQELIDTIQSTLAVGDSVRIKHLGIFKAAEENDHADPPTSHRILLPGYNRINFIPDSNLANAVNEPFLLFDSVELDEEEPVAVAPPPVPTAPVPPPIPTTHISAPIEKPSEFPKPDASRENALYQPPKEHSRHRRDKRWKKSPIAPFIFFLLSAIPMVILGYYLYFLDDGNMVKNARATHAPSTSYASHNTTYPSTFTGENTASTTPVPPPAETPPAEVVPAIPVAVPAEATPANAAPVVSPPAVAATAALPPSADPPPVSASVKRYRIQPGDYLTTIAQNEYGKTVFWVYIYEENKALIKNPNIVPEGIVILLPPASKYGIDPYDPTSVRKATELQRSLFATMESNSYSEYDDDY